MTFMQTELYQKLSSEVDTTNWEMIHPHFLRDVVYLLKSPNDLIQMGILVAENKAHLIQGFLAAGELYKPTESEVEQFKNDLKINFKVLIIQPFVFIQRAE